MGLPQRANTINSFKTEHHKLIASPQKIPGVRFCSCRMHQRVKGIQKGCHENLANAARFGFYNDWALFGSIAKCIERNIFPLTIL